MLYTVRDECARDLRPTLREVARIGYEGVELFDLHGRHAGRVRGVLDRYRARRLRAPRAARCDRVRASELAAEAGRLGWRRLVVSWADPSELGPTLARPARAGRGRPLQRTASSSDSTTTTPR